MNNIGMNNNNNIIINADFIKHLPNIEMMNFVVVLMQMQKPHRIQYLFY